ncbi:MAG TPA: hypothetical protein VGY55_07590 [Pirellulales bacterium]|nr:hypothetical protein [Pirellulales bacterium]
MQFTTAEAGNSNSPAPVAGQHCIACRQPIASTYYALGDKLLCPVCRERVIAGPSGSQFGRVVRATLMGLGAGLLGALIWFLIRRVAQLEIGLVAILVGFMVGKAVRKGSGGRGGRGYQVLAVALTYCCIAANYMPDVVEAVFRVAREHRSKAALQPGVDNKSQTGSATGDAAGKAASGSPENPKPQVGLARTIGAMALLVLLVIALSLATPFLPGAQNIIGLLIIGFALWEAWKFNARRPLPISGPYQMGPQPSVATTVEIANPGSAGGTSA